MEPHRRMVNGFAPRSTLAALLVGITAPCVAMAEPRTLADVEMDAITAAGVVVEVDAYARALGTIAVTRTDARALTSIIEEGIEIGAGFAEGQAYACCGNGSSVVVGSSAAGGDDVVYGGSFSHVFHGAALTSDGALRRFAFGYSAALLLTVSSDALLSARALDGALGELGRKFIGGGQTVSGNGLVTGYAFAPVYTAGLRWHAARYLVRQRHDFPEVATASQTAARQLIGVNQTMSRK
jgi:hypothetical protein